MIDTHTHLYAEQFDEDRAEVIERAIQAGVNQFYMPSIDSTYTQAMVDLKNQYSDRIHLMMGVHPTHVNPETIQKELDHVKKWLDKGDFVAVGEIGIDLYWEKKYLEEQKAAFCQQIEWAKEKKLPIVIHSRESFDEVFEILERYNDDDLFGIFHCFSGNLEQAQQAIHYGMKLGIGGVVTFKNGKIDQFLNQIDLQYLVLETDSPYLAPVPHRGKRNESAHVKLVAEKLAQVYSCSVDEIVEQTTKNTIEIFK